jgi:nitronate monooxygenase
MPIATPLTQALGLVHPIIQAPMAGGSVPVDMVAAVAGAGALGFISAAYSTPAQIVEMGRAVRAKTDRPYGVNLFVALPVPEMPRDAQRAIDRLVPFHAELGLAPPTLPNDVKEPFAEQFPAVLESGAKVFSFTFGIPPREAIAAAKARGITVVGTATTVPEAVQLQEAGVDAVVAQGSEAGAHRGTFASPFEMAMIGTMALVPQVANAIDVPVIASGGIMDGRGIAAALALGAQAVQMGTAFLVCDEAATPAVHKEAILAAYGHETRLTQAFSGRHARGIVNTAMATIDGDEPGFLPYPLQNALTRPMRTAAAKQGRSEFLSLWAGQGARLARRMPVADLVTRLAAETDEALARVSALQSS